MICQYLFKEAGINVGHDLIAIKINYVVFQRYTKIVCVPVAAIEDNVYTTLYSLILFYCYPLSILNLLTELSTFIFQISYNNAAILIM